MKEKKQNAEVESPANIKGQGDSNTRLDGVVFLIVGAIALLLPIVFLPLNGISFALVKTTLLSLGVAIALVLWVVARLQSGSVVFPKTWILPALFGILGISFISSFFAGTPTVSLFGEMVEIDSVSLLLSFVVFALLGALTMDNRNKVHLLYLGVGWVVGVLGLFHIYRFFFGVEALLGNIFGSTLATPLGQWNDLGVLFGLTLLTSVIILSVAELRPLQSSMLYALFAVSLGMVFVVNLTAVWVSLAVLSFILLVYLLSIRFVRREDVRSGTMRTAGVVLASILIVVSLSTLISEGRLSQNMSNLLGVTQVEARPSWNGTLSIAGKVLKEDPLLGIGPNQFQNAWLLHKPEGVNRTVFWNTDFTRGVGHIPSAAVTTGILGLIAWLLFLGVFLKEGFQALFADGIGSRSRFSILLTFLSTLYLWLFAVVYTPGIALYALTFLSTGVFVGVLVREGILETQTIELGTQPKWNFLIVLFSVLLIVGGSLFVYFSGERALARGLYERALVEYGATGDMVEAERAIVRSLELHELDRYYRSLAELRVQKLSTIVSQSDVSNEVRQSEFRETIGEAINAAQLAIQKDPNNYRNYVTLGGVYEPLVSAQVEGAYENARLVYEEAIKHNPHSPALYLRIARLEANNGDFDRAREEIGNALTLKPNYTEAIFFLSQIEVAEGNIQDAIRTVEAATFITPNDATVYFQLGLLRYNNEQFTNAIGAFENAIRLNPSYSNARYFLGLSYDEVGRTEEAIVQFERIQELNPENREVAFILENIRVGRDPFANAQPPIDNDPEDREMLPIEE